MTLIATLNVGSSSVKFAAFDRGEEGPARLRGEVDGFGAAARITVACGTGELQAEAMERPPADHAEAVRLACERLVRAAGDGRVAAVGHRVVHGGAAFSEPVRINEEVLATLTALAPLAPLHQPHNLAGIAAARDAFPEAAQIACLDTAFHRSHPFVADVFALPRSFYDAGVRRYGFHGLSYAYVVGELAALDPQAGRGRVVVAHLGNGASMCAIEGGRSVESSMGFSALDGLPMGTRCGAIDPGVVLHLLQAHRMTPETVSELLYKRSGLLGLSGVSHDMRALLASDDAWAVRAIDYFVHRVRRELGAMAAVLGGLDAVVFTGGIGANAAPIRARICAGLDWLGVRVDEDANRAGAQCISASSSSLVRVYVIATDEERMIARQVRAMLADA